LSAQPCRAAGYPLATLLTPENVGTLLFKVINRWGLGNTLWWVTKIRYLQGD